MGGGYGLVTPERTGRGNRLYQQEDIDRLVMIKALVDDGHPVSIVARLSVAELQARIDAGQPQATLSRASVAPVLRAAVMGSELALRMKHDAATLPGIRMVGAFRDAAETDTGARALRPDVLVLEFPTLTPDAPDSVRNLLRSSGAGAAVVVYRIGSRQALDELSRRGISSMRWPVDLAELGRLCAQAAQRRGDSSLPGGDPAAVPPSRFRPDQLARLAVMDTPVTCECPRHLAELINSLSAFEAYSADCLSRNRDDAEVHAFLGNAAGTARALIETGLERVIALEKIDLG